MAREIKSNKFRDEWDMSHLLNAVVAYKGGKSAPVPPPTIAPTPAVEEASVEITDEDKKKRLETGKKELKIPLTTASDTALKTGNRTQTQTQAGGNTNSGSGLK